METQIILWNFRNFLPGEISMTEYPPDVFCVIPGAWIRGRLWITNYRIVFVPLTCVARLLYLHISVELYILTRKCIFYNNYNAVLKAYVKSFIKKSRRCNYLIRFTIDVYNSAIVYVCLNNFIIIICVESQCCSFFHFCYNFMV